MAFKAFPGSSSGSERTESGARWGDGGLADAIDAIASPVLVVSRGFVVHANEAATALLSGPTAVGDSSGGAPEPLRADVVFAGASGVEVVAVRMVPALDAEIVTLRAAAAEEPGDAFLSLQMARLQAVTSALSRSVTEAEVADVVVRQAVDSTGSDTGGVLYQMSDDGRALELIADHATPRPVMGEVARLSIDGDMPAASVARTREAVWIETGAEYERDFPRLARLFRPHTGSEALCVLPLVVGDRLLGVMGMGFREPRAFPPSERAFISTLAQHCAQALDRARAYERERAARAEAEGARRAREELLAFVAHDLKNPLGMVVLAAGSLHRRAPVGDYGESVQRGANNILYAASRMERLVRDLLDAASIEAGHLSLSRDAAVDVGALVEDVMRLQIPYAEEKGITLTRVIDDQIHAEVDRDRITQVITNLASNALKFTPRGGEVTVRLERVAAALTVHVEDSGPGIAPDELPGLFARFGSGRRPGAETGLGLFIAKGIVDAHGGRIDVLTEIAKGSVFSVTLPIAAPLDPRVPG